MIYALVYVVIGLGVAVYTARQYHLAPEKDASDT